MEVWCAKKILGGLAPKEKVLSWSHSCPGQGRRAEPVCWGGCIGLEWGLPPRGPREASLGVHDALDLSSLESEAELFFLMNKLY